MSAFFVSRQTIHDAVTAWCWAYARPRGQADLDQIGRSFWAMNADAMRQRYPQIIGTDEDRDNIGAAAAYCYRRPVNLTMAQASKSVHCLTYQCAEGDVIHSELFKALDRLADAMGTPLGYDAAAWDRETDSAQVAA